MKSPCPPWAGLTAFFIIKFIFFTKLLTGQAQIKYKRPSHEGLLFKT